MAEDTYDPLDPSDIERAHGVRVEVVGDAIDRAQAELRGRQEAYGRVFKGQPFAGDVDKVLADLRKFCRGGQTPWDADPRVHALLTGRFEVYTRIQQHLGMSFDELWETLNGA